MRETVKQFTLWRDKKIKEFMYINICTFIDVYPIYNINDVIEVLVEHYSECFHGECVYNETNYTSSSITLVFDYIKLKELMNEHLNNKVKASISAGVFEERRYRDRL